MSAKLRTREAMLHGPIFATMMRMALPTIGVLVAQTIVNVAETYYVSFLGAPALVGVALVFPVWMLVTMMAAGGIGGGVASAVARAAGAGMHGDANANALVVHAVVIAIAFGLAFSILTIGMGSHLYSALGGTGEALQSAQTYSTFVFLAAIPIPIWIVNLLSAALRGIGNVRVSKRQASRRPRDGLCCSVARVGTEESSGKCARDRYREDRRLYPAHCDRLSSKASAKTRLRIAGAIWAVMVGTLQLSRIVPNKELSTQLLKDGIANALRLASEIEEPNAA